MVRFSLSLSVAIFFSHKFSENNHRQRECLLEIRTGCGILRGTLSLSLSLSLSQMRESLKQFMTNFLGTVATNLQRG
jgi:hypothetical protein